MATRRSGWWIRKLHRWVALLVALQMLAWVAGGLYFSLFPISEIRGEHLISQHNALSPQQWQRILPRQAHSRLATESPLEELRVVPRHGGLYFRAVQNGSAQLFDFTSGQPFAGVNASQAERIAVQALIPNAAVTGVQRITSVPDDDEYRGQPLPAYQVSFDHSSGVRVYVSEATGEVVTRRTTAWRIFDFLWMLHIMDYESRDDFNHWLLTFAASIALLAILSGLLLWVNSSRWFRTRSPQAPES